MLSEIGISIPKEEKRAYDDGGFPLLTDITIDDTEDARSLLPRLNDLSFRYPKGIEHVRR